jgi:Domain of unknown function (DUF6321)
MAAKKSSRRPRPPWKRPGPSKRPRKLSSAQRSAAKQRAQKAGRRYPNLVDNMAVASKRKSPKRKLPKRKKASRKSASALKDPQGGLTAQGRSMFRRRDGSRLKPGVKKSVREMSPEEMRRKGSWASRFYGRKQLPPLRKANGEPTRFALSAHAWGEPIPKTVAAARRIAAKGRRLLEAYERLRKR